MITYRQAWVEEPLSALQLAAHLRDVRDGKGERERFHDAAAWLASRHPSTLLANLEGIAQVCQRSVSHSLAVAMNANPAYHHTCLVFLWCQGVLRLREHALVRDPLLASLRPGTGRTC